MRYRLMATYQGSPFEAGIGPTRADVVLFAACPPPEELGFEPATGHWRKQLTLADVEAVWESRPVGMFRGARCMVLDDLGDRLHIGFLGHDAYEAERLGYWQVDRGVYEVIAPRTEVTDLVEQQAEYPRRPAGSPGYPPAESSIYVSSAPAGSSPGYLPSGPIGYRMDADPASSGPFAAPGYGPAAEGAGLTAPAPEGTPLPLEAAALRAASQASQSRLRPLSAGAGADPVADAALPAASHQAQDPAPADSATTGSHAAHPAGPSPVPHTGSPAQEAEPSGGLADTPAPAGRRARKRLGTELLFAELASMAGIPMDAYAIGEEVEGAMCLLESVHGFEVFQSVNGSRLELKFFSSEESACFYLFGVLAAEAVRNGSLVPHKPRRLPLRRPLPAAC